MGIIMGALGGMGAAGQDMFSARMKSDMDLDSRLAVGKQNSDLELQRQQTMEVFKNNLAVSTADQQRSAQTSRIDAAAGTIAEPAIAQKRGIIQSGIEDQSTWTPEQQATVDQSLAGDRQTAIADPKTRTQAAIASGDIDPKSAATLASHAEIQQIKTDALIQGLEGRLAMAKNKGEIQLLLAEIKAVQGRDGKPPVGYRTTQNGDLQAIPGGPADLKLQGSFNADTAQLTGSIAGFDRLASAANDVLKHPGLNGITGWRGKIPNGPGTDAANAEALLGTLKSQVGFGVLQDMRNNSKTGGALGAVSDAEGKRLESNLAALDKAQSPEQFRTQLEKIVEYSEQAKDRMRDSFNIKHSDKPTGTSGTIAVKTATDYANVPSGATYTSPDGKIRRKP